MVIYNNKKVLFFRRISFNGWKDYTNNWFDGTGYFNCSDIYNLFDNNIDVKKYINENFAIDYKGHDIIKGYRADDSYFSFAKAFLNNTISVQQLEKAMVLGKLGEQVVIMSEKAFDSIEYVDSTFVPKEIYYPKSNARDNYARNEFAKEKNRGLVLEESYMIDIMREEWKNDDDRLQRIVLG